MSWQVSGTYNYNKNENDITPAELKANSVSVSVAYTGTAGRFVYLGYNRLDYDMTVATTFPVFFSPTNFPILYDHAESVWTLGGEYAISGPFAIYANLNYVDSDGVESGLGANGSTSAFQLPLTYYDIWIGVRYVLGMGIFIDAQGRFMEYQDDSELLSGLDSYRSDMFVLGLGYRF